MTNELTDVRCSCGDEYPADSYDAGFIAGSGMCQNCDAALPPKDICTCPSGDGSLRHPCPAHPAVEQAGGDERVVDGKPRATKCPDCGEGDLMPGDLCACGYETDPAAGYACSECDGSGEGCVGEVCRECDGSGWFVTPEQARAALAQPSPAPTMRAAIDVANDRFEVPVAKWGTDLAGEEERPEVVAWRYGFSGGIVSDKACLDEWKSGGEYQSLMTVAQHERIVGELRFERKQMDRAFTACINERDAANARLHEVATACATAEQERDAALARIAELERKLSNEENAHTTTIEQRDNAEHWADQLANAIAERFGVDIGEHSNLNCPWNEALVWMQQPPAQAQHSVPEGWKLVPSDKGCVTSSMKAECIGEFSFYIRAACAECLDVGTDSDCHVCGGDIEYDQKIDVPWDTCKEIYKAMLAAAPGKEEV